MTIFFASLFISYLVMAVAEYVLHRYTMHKRFFPKGWFDDVFENHAILHHKEDRLDLNIDLPIWYHLILSSPVIIALYFLSIPAMLGWLTIMVYHSWLWTHAHRAIHGLEHNWLEKTEFYRQMKDHHEAHHDHPNRNFGVCFFWVDELMGTKL
jgi:sterol desaturase/sphingolipid hydroxylase (fatty acid hydroxylase superfamily)